MAFDGVGGGAAVAGVPYVVFLVPGLVAMRSLMRGYGIAREPNISRFAFRVFDGFLVAPVPAHGVVPGGVLAAGFLALALRALQRVGA